MEKVMFLCTGNSCRSQMAEGFLRELSKGSVEVYSAGLFSAGLHPRAVSVMREIGIDITGQWSKAIDERLVKGMDIVVTLCGNAEAACPVTPAPVKRLYWPVKDPVGTIGHEDRIMNEFRRARDEIREKVEELLEILKKTP